MTRSPTRVALAATLLLAALTTATPAAGQDAAPDGTESGLTFGWKIPARCGVTVVQEKKGNAVKTRYELHLREEPASEHLRLSFENVEILEVNGMDVTTPAGKAMLGPAAAAGAMYPDLIIAKDGTFVDAVGVEEMIDRTLELIEEQQRAQGQFDEETHAQVTAMMKAPGMVAQVTMKSSESWEVWVGAWIGVDAAAGESMEGEVPLPMPDGSTLPGKLKITNEGAAADVPGHIELRLENLVAGEEARATFAAFMKKMMKDMADGAAMPKILSFEKRSEVTAVIDPSTLRPHGVKTQATAVIEMEGVGEQRQVERSSYEFDWSIGK